MITVGDIRSVLERAYPPALAESWDHVGLLAGDPSDPVETVAFALDCTERTARAAIEAGAQLLVVHHPFLLRGVNSVAADTPKGQVLHQLIRNGVALFAAHTNADCARPGVNDHLIELLGATSGRPIVPKDPAAKDRWGVHVPEGSVEELKAALFDAGTGLIGRYSRCAFQVLGTGQFLPESGADPALGEVGREEKVPEVRLSFVALRSRRRAILATLRASHPYEEPAFDITEIASDAPLETLPGLGRVGKLPRPEPLREFVQRVADALPETVWGVRATGDPDRMVRTIAVCSGAGDSLLDSVAGLGVDAYVTSDLRHHPVDEFLRSAGVAGEPPAVIDTAHWASEYPWTSQAERLITSAFGASLRTVILPHRTDPWTLSAHPEHSMRN